MQAAPVAGEVMIAGMVLTLEEVTGVLDREQQRLRLLHALTSSVRSPAANLRAAAENLASYPDMEAERRLRFIQIVAAESAASRSIDEALRGYADAVKASLTPSDMRAAELVAARRRLEALPGLAVESDSRATSCGAARQFFAIIQAFGLSDKLRAEYGVRRVPSRRGRGKVELDLGWEGAIVASEALSLWETQPLGVGRSTLRDVRAPRRRGSVTPRDLAGSAAARSASSCRWASRQPRRSAWRAAESRPEYYDFDLFRYMATPRELRAAPWISRTPCRHRRGLEPRPATRSSASGRCAS